MTEKKPGAEAYTRACANLQTVLGPVLGIRGDGYYDFPGLDEEAARVQAELDAGSISPEDTIDGIPVPTRAIEESLQDMLRQYVANPTTAALVRLHKAASALLPGAQVPPLVTIEVTAGGLVVRSPYNERWVTAAKSLQGKWEAGAWKFSDARSLELVREKLLDVYGEYGEPVERHTVRVRLSGEAGPSLYGFGRQLVHRAGRDRTVELGARVYKVAGPDFTAWGGSTKYPAIGQVSDVALEIRDVPASKLGELPDGSVLYMVDGAAVLPDPNEQS